jgi:hypothetical protein
MKKTISLFQRNYGGDHLVRDQLVPGAEWVANGEGVATRKLDGTCCLWRNGHLWKRYELKKGKTPPIGFEPAQDPDPVTGKVPGWVPVGQGPEDIYYHEALERFSSPDEGGTYELCGPKVQKNPEKYPAHVLIRHGSIQEKDCPRTFGELREYLRDRDIEGIVWHHSDGRMVKIKGKDFGLRRPD